MHCTPYGRLISCRSLGTADLQLLPYWKLHSTPIDAAFGEAYTIDRAPKTWTRLTMHIHRTEAETAPPVAACVEVRHHDDRAQIRRCQKEPPRE